MLGRWGREGGQVLAGVTVAEVRLEADEVVGLAEHLQILHSIEVCGGEWGRGYSVRAELCYIRE